MIPMLVVGALFIILVWSKDGFTEMVLVLPFPLLLVFFSSWMWFWPRLVLSADSVTVINQFRTIVVPWSDLDQAEVNFGLYLKGSSSNKKFNYRAAGIPGNPRRGKATTSQSELPLQVDIPRESVSLSLDAVQAAALINSEIHARKSNKGKSGYWTVDKNSDSDNASSNVIIRWNWPPIATLIVLLIWCLFSVYLIR